MAFTRTDALRERDLVRLRDIHPRLVAIILTILDVMEVLGRPMFVVSGARTAAEQFALYQRGRTFVDGVWRKTGDTVTNCDGTVKRSDHQVDPDGYGYAVDLAFVDDPDTTAAETWTGPWNLVGTIAEHLGASWGGRWTDPVDKPHVYLRKDAPVLMRRA
jgi:peptidoglycan L-alanyl-D-glutamate endopeptidase CwlK